ncbi:hypothetical protein NX059_006743 [Plenodomus lindquistii]|nr:hypothetical protein NX059_006743 [Plenodomus lindquistii]
MYASHYQPTPPPGYGFEYRHDTPPMSPGHTAREYYSPRHGPAATPTSRSSPKVSGHSRRASYAVPPQYSAYPTQRGGAMPQYGADFTAQRSYATPRGTPDYVPIYESQQKPTSRARRASESARPQPASASPKKTRKPAPTTKEKEKTKRKATAEDAQRAGIPAGYSYKNWDPEEEPIMLLGSVFDADSLGKWIFDWTVYHYGPGTPIAEMAGELWLLLIHLAAKVKRSIETRHRIRKDANKEMVDDFLESGERLWIRFAMLLKVCEDYMWKAAKQESGIEKPVAMGKNTGVEFVESIFGRDRELEKTEKLMTGMRLWSHRFDVNCVPILDYPAL